MTRIKIQACLVTALAVAPAGCLLGNSSLSTMPKGRLISSNGDGYGALIGGEGRNAPSGGIDRMNAPPSGVADGENAPPTGVGDGNLVVPNLIGRTREEAREILKAAGFANAPESTRPVYCENAPEEPGRINCQDPAAGKLVRPYKTIRITVYQSPGIAGSIVRSQLDALKGLTPDQAKVQLKKLGHDGRVSVSEVTNSGGGPTYVKECGQNKVCGTSGGPGISVHGDLTLYINPTLTIAPPP